MPVTHLEALGSLVESDLKVLAADSGIPKVHEVAAVQVSRHLAPAYAAPLCHPERPAIPVTLYRAQALQYEHVLGHQRKAVGSRGVGLSTFRLGIQAFPALADQILD